MVSQQTLSGTPVPWRYGASTGATGATDELDRRITTMTTATKPSSLHESASDASMTLGDLTQHAREAAGSVSDAADGVSARLPDAATEVDRLIRSSSDDTLRIVTAGAVGVAVVLLVAGANRLLIVAALIPAGIVALALSGRRSV
jgi:hypothetical protein